MKTKNGILTIILAFLIAGLAGMYINGCSRPQARTNTNINMPPMTQPAPATAPATMPASGGSVSSQSTQVNAGTTTGTVAVTADLQHLIDLSIGKSLVDFYAQLDAKINAKVTAQIGLIAKTVNTTSTSSNTTSGDQSPAFNFTGSGAYLMGGCILLAIIAVYFIYARSHYKMALKRVVSALPDTALGVSDLGPTGPVAQAIKNTASENTVMSIRRRAMGDKFRMSA